MKRALLLLPVLALAVAAAGCGGGGSKGTQGSPLSKEEYLAKIQEIVKTVGEQFTGVEANSPEALEKGVEALKDVADELEKISPPEEIATLHDDLIDGIRSFAEELPGFADKLEATEDPGEAIAILFGSKSIQKLAKTQEALKKAGYTIDLNQTETTP